MRLRSLALFGLLAMEIAISPTMKEAATYVGGVFFIIALIFVGRSFYSMRIPKE